MPSSHFVCWFFQKKRDALPGLWKRKEFSQGIIFGAGKGINVFFIKARRYSSNEEALKCNSLPPSDTDLGTLF